ncbi:MAG: hypothetical protein KF887_17370 [Paracoccaceae bacterium]|nr:MAG: hypothetical protein KF887_17370 [Paracoccaceae bacterium]
MTLPHPERPPLTPAVTALRLGLLYFAAVFTLGLAFGTVRAIGLAPRIGEPAAVALELPLILSVAWMICGHLLRGHSLSRGGAAVMGGAAFLLLMLAETALSVLLFGRTAAQHLALYAEPAHRLGLAGQIAFAAMPMLRRRG